MSFSMIAGLLALILAAPFGASVQGASAADSSRKTKVYGEIRPDKALVYFGGVLRYIYVDDTLLGTMRTGSYGFSYIDPGTHLIWTDYPDVFRVLEFLPGRTYFLFVFAHEIVLHEGENALRIIEASSYYRAPTEEEKTKAQTRIANRYEDVKRYTTKVYGEIRPDQALVYIICGATPSSAWTVYLYADDTFLGTVGHNSYSFVYISPGEHLLWTNERDVFEELEFLPGRTYYVRVEEGITLLREEEGRRLLENVRFFHVTTDEQEVKAERRLAGGYEKAKRREAERQKVEVEMAAAPAPPVDLAGKLRVPAGTDIRVDLLENLSSAHNSPGETIWFRTAGDLTADGTLVVPEGTLVAGTARRTERSHRMGKGGLLDVVIPGIRAPDGTTIPTVGRVLAAGSSGTMESREFSSTPVPFLGFLAFLITGGEATAFVGDTYVVTTRADVWLKAAPTLPSEKPAPAAERSGVFHLPVHANVVTYDASRRRDFEAVVFRTHAERRVKDVAIVQVDGFELPLPCPAQRVSMGERGSEFRFAGWSVLRYVRPRGAAGVAPILLSGTFEDGTPFIGRADLDVRLAQ